MNRELDATGSIWYVSYPLSGAKDKVKSTGGGGTKV